MPTKGLVLYDEKVRFKGRFCTDALNEITLAKLAAAVKNNKGKKTRLKLTREGVSCGQMFGTILRNRIAAEFKPMRDVEDIVVDQVSNLLLVIVRLLDENYEIMAFSGDQQVLKRFENTFLTVKSYDTTSTIPDVHVTDNWTLRQNNKPARPTVLNMYTPQSHMNGVVPNGEMNRSRSVQDFNTSRQSSARRSRSKSRDEADGLSDTSQRSAESVKRELLNLSREVQSLRSMVEHTGTMSTMRGLNDVDSVITSASSRLPPGSTRAKQKVHDHRRSNGTTIHVDTMDGNSNYARSRADGPIHLVYRREGERSGSPLRYQSSNASTMNTLRGDSSTMHTLRAGDSRSNTIHRSPDAGSTYSSFYPTTQRRLVTPVPIGPARTYGAAVGSLNDGNRTLYKTKSTDHSPNRWKYRDSDWEGSVYSTRTYTAPSRQARTLDRKIYTSGHHAGHPDFSYVNLVPSRSQSTSRFDTRRSERW